MGEILNLPTVHLNGTSKEALADGYRNAHTQLSEAISALGETYPNARDYYVQISPDAYKNAVRQHEQRLTRLQEVLKELEVLFFGVDSQGR